MHRWQLNSWRHWTLYHNSFVLISSCTTDIFTFLGQPQNKKERWIMINRSLGSCIPNCSSFLSSVPFCWTNFCVGQVFQSGCWRTRRRSVWYNTHHLFHPRVYNSYTADYSSAVAEHRICNALHCLLLFFLEGRQSAFPYLVTDWNYIYSNSATTVENIPSHTAQ